MKKTNVDCLVNTIDSMATHASLELPLDLLCALGSKANKDLTLNTCETK